MSGDTSKSSPVGSEKETSMVGSRRRLSIEYLARVKKIIERDFGNISEKEVYIWLLEIDHDYEEGECPFCEDGATFEDRFSHTTGHYTVTVTCEYCEGTGRLKN